MAHELWNPTHVTRHVIHDVVTQHTTYRRDTRHGTLWFCGQENDNVIVHSRAVEVEVGAAVLLAHAAGIHTEADSGTVWRTKLLSCLPQ